MKRLTFLLILALFVAAFAMQTIPALAYSVGTFQPIFEGMWYAEAIVGSPRLMHAFALKIDLQNPYVATAASPGNGGNPYETALQTTPNFLSQYQLKCAVNASFFDAGLSPNTDIWGLLVSGGSVVSTPNAYPFNSWLSCTASKVAQIAAGSSVPAGANNAVGGAEILMTGGVNGNVPDSDLQPRTCYGLSQDNRYLIMVCVDGRQPGWSDGANNWDQTEFARNWGAWTVVKMDGGGSTTMARALNGQVVVCNRPCYGYNRAVGSNYGIYSSDIVNPYYLFDSNNNHWYSGNGCTGITWTNCCGWPGIIYVDQNGADCWIQSGTTNFTGAFGPQCVNVNVYPQNGTTASHDMQFNWMNAVENYYDAAKSSSVVNYTAQNAWTSINLDCNNAKWWNQNITQMRVDFDAANTGTRWIVNHVVKQNAIWYSFSSSLEGWTVGQSLSGLSQTTCCGWGMGILYCDQTANDAYLHGPAIPLGGDNPFNYLGGANDKIRVIVYPQNGTTASHDMAIYWKTEGDSVFTEPKSTHVNFTGQNQWCTVDIPVGTNTNWNGKHVTQLRLDFDQVNHGNRWHVDSIASIY